MPKSDASLKNAHFLGTKIRNLRKQNHLTMEDLSTRCTKIDVEAAPSVSFLSMIERGKRMPRMETLRVIAEVFQRDLDWFMDDVADKESVVPNKGGRGGLPGMALEPAFLFSNDILQLAVPELLSQTGVTGRQFAQLLIRAHQELHHNNFPDLERAAESIGKKQMPMSVDDLLGIVRSMGLKIKWLDDDKKSDGAKWRSYFEAPNKIYLNKLLKSQPDRLKYDLAVYIGHATLHDGDGVKSPLVIGYRQVTLGERLTDVSQRGIVDTSDIMHAWRDFECSFFAGALLCPKLPFRRLLDRHAYETTTASLSEVSLSVAMRRMTAVSSYPHWHYFHAFPPGQLTAVYRANGIPLPWGNMRMVEDPCQHWAVFRMLAAKPDETTAQISVLTTDQQPRIYCCETVKTQDLGGNDQVVCAGIDINPALEAQGMDANDIARELEATCMLNGGASTIPPSIRHSLERVSKILNISWMQRGIDGGARVICPRSNTCPRNPPCH